MSTGGVGLRSERGPVLLAMMVATALVAIDSTIIATAVPSIVSSIGGFADFPWLFSIYLLAQAVTVPVYGKLSDLFGRKPVMLFGIGLFLFGSVICGVAWNMTVLIAFRAVQGLGAGAVLPMSITIVGDLYTIEERAKVQGYLASMWGMASVVGPTLGGVFSEYVSWRWIFFVNIPLCLLAAGLVWTRFHESERASSRPVIDYRGAAVLTSGLTLVILGLLEGGQAWQWDSAQSIAILAVGVALLVAFVRLERGIDHAVVPLWIFTRRLLVTTSLVSAGVGAIVLGLTSYIPTFVQDALGTGPLVAGFAVAALTLGWPLAAAQSGRVYLRIGIRRCALIGAAVILVGCLLLLLVGQHSGVVQVGATCFVIGLGMGWVATPTLIAAQTSIEWHQRGVVTGNNMFFRSMGSALGVAVFGAIANATLGRGVLEGGHVPAASLTTAVNHVFVAVAVLAVLTLLGVWLMPRDQSTAPDATATGSPAGTSTGDATSGDGATREESASTASASTITPAP